MSESSALTDNGTIYLCEEITSASTKPVIEFILTQGALPQEKRPTALTLIVNSRGGNTPDAFALIDIMKGSIIPIHTLGLGIVSSCGLMIFMAGEKGYRVLTPNTQVLSHQFSWGVAGKEHELMARVEEFKLMSERLVSLYKECTGQSEEVVHEKLLPAKDVWMSGEEAVELGLADEMRAMY